VCVCEIDLNREGSVTYVHDHSEKVKQVIVFLCSNIFDVLTTS
jgi:hypothetical protein